MLATLCVEHSILSHWRGEDSKLAMLFNSPRPILGEVEILGEERDVSISGEGVL